MKISINWLKNYINIEDLTVKEIANSLTLAGLEVESIITTDIIDGIVVGEILSINKHPNADKLNLCKVTDGVKEYHIVCGASNLYQGMKSVFAKIGTVLPEIKLKPAKIRGIESFGMLCSEKDLGISNQNEGIIELPQDIDVGISASEILGLGDTILELNVTPNRPDWLSVIGVAREIGAIFEREVTEPVLKLKESSEKISDIYSDLYIDVKDTDKCPIYACKVIKNVKVKASPLWMQQRLHSSGIRSINNVVDITNYILLEYGQPLHAFDRDRLNGGITIRNAKEDEVIITLDGKQRKLNENVLVIADESRNLVIAGIMGGEFSGITENTSTILLECAYFEPNNIRKTSKKLNLSSESSYRYERGVDYGKSMELLDYAAMMICKYCGGVILSGKVGGEFKKMTPPVVKSSVESINKLLGTDISSNDMLKYLNNLGIKSLANGDEIVSISPTYRVDINQKADIAEEIARCYGYDNIPTTIAAPKIDADKLPIVNNKVKNIRSHLESLGFNEVLNFSFLGADYLLNFDKEENFVKIMNPISSDMAWMRTKIYPSLLKNIQLNSNQGESSIKIFEIGSSYISQGKNKLANESVKLALGIYGNAMSTSWIKINTIDTFYYLKGIIDHILISLHIEGEYKISQNKELLHPMKSADIYINEENIGFIGCIHPGFAEKIDIKPNTYISEIDLEKIIKLSSSKDFKYKKFSRFPSIERDIAVVLPKDIAVGSMIKDIEAISNLIKTIEIFDIYDGKGIEKGLKSVAFRMVFSDINGTLNDSIINPIIDNILQTLESKYQGTLR